MRIAYWLQISDVAEWPLLGGRLNRDVYVWRPEEVLQRDEETRI